MLNSITYVKILILRYTCSKKRILVLLLMWLTKNMVNKACTVTVRNFDGKHTKIEKMVFKQNANGFFLLEYYGNT